MCPFYVFCDLLSREIAHWPLQSQSCATAQWCCVGGRKWPFNEMSPALVWPLGAGLVDTGGRYWILLLPHFRCTHSVQPDGRYGSSTDTHFAWVSENLTCQKICFQLPLTVNIWQPCKHLEHFTHERRQMIFYRQQVPMRHSLKSSERFRTIPGAAALILAICSIGCVALLLET